MDNNIDKKIKSISLTFGILGMSFGVIAFLVIWILSINSRNGIEGFFIALITGGIIILFSWLAKLILFGFGQLIENSRIATQKINQQNEILIKMLNEVKHFDQRFGNGKDNDNYTVAIQKSSCSSIGGSAFNDSIGASALNNSSPEIHNEKPYNPLWPGWKFANKDDSAGNKDAQHE